ncbi:MAG: hypothetical protein QXJ27_07370, partial [Thermoplasmata archaeon]
MSEEMEKIREYQKVIREILSAFESVSFPVIVESSTGCKVLSIDKDRDNDLIEDISSVARSIVLRYHNQPITRDTYWKVIKRKANAFRPNEVGRILEYEICNTSKDFKTIKEIVSLKQVGYP